jgi:aminopeptidase N
MENVGAVTYNDLFIKPREEMTDSLRFRVTYVTLHELAHMWFGDLVTMKWWNDLWLKESFADFCALMCLMECKEELTMQGEKQHIYGNPEVMQTKFIEHALNADVKKSLTHPIQVQVNHTIDAVNVFDEICYEKGACFIKTLKNYIGREALSEGVKEYFMKFRFSNTETKDFIRTLQEVLERRGEGKNLKEWTDSWINKAGANPIEPVIERDEANNRFYVHLK